MNVHQPISGHMVEALGLRGIPERALMRRRDAARCSPLVDEINIDTHVVGERLTARPVSDYLLDRVDLFHASHSGRLFQICKVEKTSMGISSRKVRLTA